MNGVYLNFMRDPSRKLPVVNYAEDVVAMRVWFCKYTTLERIVDYPMLWQLVIAGYPDASLDSIGELRRLTYLSIVHMPHVDDLGALTHLQELTTLSLSTLPAWDASRRVTEVKSLAPIASLPMLMHLELFGVCDHERSLRQIDKISTLRTARFSRYPQNEVKRFYAATHVANEFSPKPAFEA